MKQLQDLLDWLNSFEKLPFEPTRQNVVEKIWQLQSEIRREQFAIHNVVGQSEQFYCTCSRAKGLDHDEEGMPYCIECQKPVQ